MRELTITLPDALAVLKEHILTDTEYAWGWQCNIAMASVDEGMSHAAANRAAAQFMYNLFGVHMWRSAYWQKNWDVKS